MRRSSINSLTSSVMVRRPMTEGITPETPISSEGMGVGNGSSTGKLVTEFATADEGDKRYDGERRNGVDGVEGVSSGSRSEERRVGKECRP